MIIKQDQIDKVLNNANIVDIISNYIDLKKRGRNYVAICPFHDDSDPSLNVSIDKKIFKCFVCGTGGNVITFVQEFNNLSFFEALILIAKELKITISGIQDFNIKKSNNTLEAKLYELNQSVTNLFNGLLASNQSIGAQNYLLKRKITPNQISRFKIGYCPKTIDVYDYLIKCGFSHELIVESGVIYQKGSKFSPFFENRIIFPIMDSDSNIIGFSGRAINDIDKPKYKNSIENKIFKKSNLVYNFNNSKKKVKILNEIIILEGFMDVISLDKIGIENSVAIMGTTLSEFHIKQFASITKNFKLFLDNDDAGIKATAKIAKILMQKDIKVTIVNNDSLKDPDELVFDNKIDYIRKIISEARHPIDFFIDVYKKDLNMSDNSSLNDFINNIFDILKYEKNNILFENAISKVSEVTNIERNVLKDSFLNSEKKEINKRNEIHKNNPENVVFSDIEDTYFDYFEKPQTKIISNVEDNLKYLKNSKNFAEAWIIWNLLESDDLLEEIEKNINKIQGVISKKIITFILEQYTSKNYFGNNWEIIANKIKDVNKLYCEKIFEIKNQYFTYLKKTLTKKGIYDCFDVIELYRIQLEIEEFNNKIKVSNSLELKKSYLEHIEYLREQRNIIYQKRRN
ncbi:DNA primase [Spiroplasma litorale]|uniref:DNA primase n=1 Tax=Spiroplasma litorale TaxID=216942 RepID=A0A0K1W0U6_9MOLU|nr:DNA primase [Spiroplasma litorale]AKX33950.1 DNA primase [Spiroplasma litorale]